MSLVKLNNIPERVTRIARVLASIIVVLAVALYSWHGNVSQYGSGYIDTPDGELYLSIADNFLKTGHFIQTARPHEVNFVVPPGLPVVYSIILLTGCGTKAILLLQYILYGITALLLMFSGGNLLKIFRYNFFIPILFATTSRRFDCPNPGMLLTETYTIFLLALIFYIFTLPKIKEVNKLIAITALILLAVFFRPALGALILLPLAYVAVKFIGGGIQKCMVISMFLEVLLFSLLVCVNGAVNKKETGYWIPLENYGVVSIYLANNINTKTYSYNSSLAKEFGDDYFWEVNSDSTLDMQKKNVLLSHKTKAFMKNNLWFCIENAMKRYINFLVEWKKQMMLLGAAILCLICAKKIKLRDFLLIAGAFCLLTFIPAFGLYISRYFIYVIVITSVITGSFFCLALYKIIGLLGHMNISILRRK